MMAWRVSGTTAPGDDGRPQTILAATPQGTAAPRVWIGLTGPDQRLTATMSPTPGRSPYYWFGPGIEPGKPFEIQIAIHADMGPGGLLSRWADDQPWSSLRSAAPWGLEKLGWPSSWTIGQIAGPATAASDNATGDRDDAEAARFRGRDLAISITAI